MTLEVKSTLEAAHETPVHRVRRARPFRRPVHLWFAALLFLCSYVALIAFVALALRMFVEGDRQQGVLALSCLAGFVAFRLMGAWKAASLSCSLCHGGVLQDKRCRKHANAKRLPFVGYRPLLVLSALFTLRFTCMYCGTLYRLKQ